ncbi:MAG: RRXRR domain-containing protein [Defluviitaleaceae bacterium]|nr:RRXRR domain-containing protein [Defluviitaleaceae bacterium]
MSKNINVIDTQGNTLAPTYPRRAKYLIKHGRARADDTGGIVLLSPPANMSIAKHKNDFAAYMAANKRAQKTVDENMRLFEQFGDTPPTADAIGQFCWSQGGAGVITAKYRFLEDYAEFCEAQSAEGTADYEMPAFAAAIRLHIHEHFEGDAWHAVTKYKQAMVPIPQDTQIDPQYLGGLSNDEFVTAFAALQSLVYGIYEGIEQGSPFEWGWPDWRGLNVYGVDHNRVMRTLGALAVGELTGDMLTVDKKHFFLCDCNKPKDRAVLMLKGFTDHGFQFEGLDDKKSATFTVSCPDSPHVMRVIHTYFQSRPNPEGCTKCSPNCESSDHCWRTTYWRHTRFISHRFVEARKLNDAKLPLSPFSTESTYNAEILARTDALPEDLRKIHYTMYEDACKVGIWADPFYDMFKDAIVYAKGTWKKHKRLIFGDSGTITVRLERVFTKHPNKQAEAEKRFPGIFTQKQPHCNPCNPDCKYRFTYAEGNETKPCCGYTNFYFNNVTPDDAMFVWELFKLDNNIKPN